MMRRTGFNDRGCDRARAWVSLELDDELSQLERALLDAHLSRCEACAAAALEARALAKTLRGAPLQRPGIRFELPQRAPARRGRTVAVRLALAATLAALAAGLGVLAGSFDRGGGGPAPADSDIAFLSPSSPDDRRDVQGVRPGGGPVDVVEPRIRGI
jgi:predicted anti-sigma-YlaC factor YlaD